MLVWILGAAFAAPAFEVDDPFLLEADLVEAWEAAATCAGFEPPAADTVTVSRSTKLSPAVSAVPVAVDGKLSGVIVGQVEPPGAFVRGLGRAWYAADPPAIREGRADLLAACVHRAVERLDVDRDDPVDLSTLEHLPDWGGYDAQGQTPDPRLARTAMIASRRLLRAAWQLTDGDPRWLSRPGGELSWPDLKTFLREKDGGALADAIGEGPDAVREALSDADGDGLVHAVEVVRETDPNDWDSDGDGWWDGAPGPDDRPEGAKPLPNDGTWVCLPMRADEDELADFDLWEVLPEGSWFHQSDKEIPHDQRSINRLTPPEAQGVGAFVVVSGEHAVETTGCADSPRITAMAETEKGEEHLQAFVDAAKAAWDDVESRAIPIERRLVAYLGGDQTVLVVRAGGDYRINISKEDLNWAANNDGWDALARMAFAMHLGSQRSHPAFRTPQFAAALLTSLVDDLPKRSWLGAYPGDVKDWLKKAKKCETGFVGLLDESCRP